MKAMNIHDPAAITKKRRSCAEMKEELRGDCPGAG